ncbi:MAG: SDR family NAD(P)-dependent oxidoreductase, partial [Acidobacteria bacterium]|nr:SDR family NAD(P)-dependent oxidoreductase [Acidobacteriota bacterium]
MSQEPASKIALVTGGSRGLGRSIALQLARKGNDVILTYRQKKEEGEAVVAEITTLGRKAVALPLDVSDLSQFAGFHHRLAQALESNWRRKDLDFLINNAGID